MIIKVKCYFPAGNLLLATKNLQDSSGNWQNKIISISSLSRNIGEDKSYEISGISIELNDSDRFFRTMMSGDNRYIAGKKVEILDENDTLIYTGNVEKWEFQEDAFSLFINDRLSGLDTVIPPTLTTEDYPDAADEGVGTSIPIIYGHVQAVKGAVKCWKVFLACPPLLSSVAPFALKEDRHKTWQTYYKKENRRKHSKTFLKKKIAKLEINISAESV